MSGSEVLVERDGPVTTVTINRPHARNACTVAMVRALHDAFMDFEADADARVAVLTGAGGSFCAGADLKELASGAAPRIFAGRPLSTARPRDCCGSGAVGRLFFRRARASSPTRQEAAPSEGAQCRFESRLAHQPISRRA